MINLMLEVEGEEMVLDENQYFDLVEWCDLVRKRFRNKLVSRMELEIVVQIC